MSEREGTPEDFARLAAALRGQDMPSKQEANRPLVESIHPPEPEPEPDLQGEEFVARLLSPKQRHAELIRRLHPDEER
jgi:hypothetical protein